LLVVCFLCCFLCDFAPLRYCCCSSFQMCLEILFTFYFLLLTGLFVVCFASLRALCVFAVIVFWASALLLLQFLRIVPQITSYFLLFTR
jgi:hypothetical protein